MILQTIINLLLPYWGIIGVVLGFGGYFLFQRDGAKKIILSLMLRLEKEAESLCLTNGTDKFQFLVDRGYQLLPVPARLLITQKMFESLAQSLYNTAKNYLIVEKVPITQLINSDPTQPILNDPTPVSTVEVPTAQVDIPVANDVLSVPDAMMKTIYDQVLAKATSDAELAIKQVIENVQKSITPIPPVE